MRKIKEFLKSLFIQDDICPKCKTKMTCYGSHPWGSFTYKCEKCKQIKGDNLYIDILENFK